MAEAKVDLRNTMHYVTWHVTIKHEQEMKWRIWLAMRLILLAGRVAGCRVEFTANIPEPEITCPVCNGMPVQIDQFDHSKVSECSFCKGKGKIRIDGQE